jgi:hypothetical protein
LEEIIQTQCLRRCVCWWICALLLLPISVIFDGH